MSREYITIDPYSRKIIVPPKMVIGGVMDDTESEILYFEMFRYYDEIDLSAHMLTIDFINAGGESDTYPVASVEVEEDIIRFSWTLSDNVTRYSGEVYFALRFESVDVPNDVVTYKWQSDRGSFRIIDRLYVSGDIAERYPDLLERWEAIIQERIAEGIETGMTDVLDEAREYAERAETAAGTLMVDDVTGIQYHFGVHDGRVFVEEVVAIGG